MRSVVLLTLWVPVFLVACDGRSPNEPELAGEALFAHVNTPTVFTATPATATEIDLAWPKGSMQLDGYQLFRSTTGPTGAFPQLASVGPTATAYADGALTASTQYCYELRSYRVTGKNTTYSAFSAAACATTLPPPLTAPSNVDIVPLHNDSYIDAINSSIRITWTNNASSEDGFRIEQASTNGGPWSQVTTVAANATSATLYVPREKQVCYRVIAYSSAGLSNPSASDCTTPPANPTGLVATVTADQRGVQLTWVDNSAVEDGYRVSRRDASGGPWTDIATLSPNVTSYTDQTVATDLGYVYRVLAMKDGGYSDDSNSATAMIATVPPSAPSNFFVNFDSYNDGYGWVYFTTWWTDQSTNEQGYRVERSADGVSGWTTETVVEANSYYSQENFDIFTASGVGGCYRVVGFNSRGDSPPSNVSCGEWGTPATNLVATAVDDHSIDLSWADNARYEKDYLVLRSTDQFGVYDVVADLPANSTTYRDVGLSSGISYWYLIVNNYDYGPSDYSNYSDYATATTTSTLTPSTSMRITVNGHPTAVRVRGLVIKKHPALTRRIHP